MSDAALLDLYHALRDTARRQLAALAASDMDDFVAATRARDALFAEVRGRDAELRALPDPTAVRAVIAQILANDAKLEELLAATSAQTQAELGRVQQGLGALNAYAADGLQQSIFIDRSS